MTATVREANGEAAHECRFAELCCIPAGGARGRPGGPPRLRLVVPGAAEAVSSDASTVSVETSGLANCPAMRPTFTEGTPASTSHHRHWRHDLELVTQLSLIASIDSAQSPPEGGSLTPGHGGECRRGPHSPANPTRLGAKAWQPLGWRVGPVGCWPSAASARARRPRCFHGKRVAGRAALRKPDPACSGPHLEVPEIADGWRRPRHDKQVVGARGDVLGRLWRANGASPPCGRCVATSPPSRWEHRCPARENTFIGVTGAIAPRVRASTASVRVKSGRSGRATLVGELLRRPGPVFDAWAGRRPCHRAALAGLLPYT